MRRAVVLSGCMVASLGIAACDSGNESAAPMSPSPSPTAETITIVANNGGRSFTPNPAFVGGQMTVWRNDHSEVHRIVANDASFDTGNLIPGQTSQMTLLPAAGTNYHCSIHPEMVGAVGGTGGQAPPDCVDPRYCD